MLILHTNKKEQDCFIKAPILLLGISRSGKTSSGKALANILRYCFYDTDMIIQTRTGLSPRQLYRQAGQTALHNAETAALQECLCVPPPTVIAAGGGICDNQKASIIVSEIPERIFLYAEQTVLFERLTQEAEQTGTYPAFLQSLPIIKKTRAEELFSILYRCRTEKYRCLATRIVNTHRLKPEAIAEKIVELLRNFPQK